MYPNRSMGDLMMKDSTSTRPRWPFGYRIVLWLVGSTLAIMLIMAIIFVLNAPS